MESNREWRIRNLQTQSLRIIPNQLTRAAPTSSRNQTAVKHEKRVLQRQSDLALRAIQPDGGQSSLALLRTNGLGLCRKNSNHASASRMYMNRESEQKAPKMTIKRALDLLTQDDEEKQICAARHIQYLCWNSDSVKKTVFHLNGIEKLMQLLHSDNEGVQHVTAAALRNIVYRNDENKMMVEKCGLNNILDALKSSHDVDTRRQLTGLLWNLSAHDELKIPLCNQFLSVLTKSVLVPGSGIFEDENPKDELLADAVVFQNATGCLRNLSCADPDCRKAMRNSENLIDSLLFYSRKTVAEKVDDQSTENCIGILCNLSYHIATEFPKGYTDELRGTQQNVAPNPKERKDLEQKSHLLVENDSSSGIEWLWNAITVRLYLSLIRCSKRRYTQEAAIAALQNITATNNKVSQEIAFTIVQKEKGLCYIKAVLDQGETELKSFALSLIKNLSCYPELQQEIAMKVLPDMWVILRHNEPITDLAIEVTACVCDILTNLSQNNLQNTKAIVEKRALEKIIRISRIDNGNEPTRAGQAACRLLHTMWNHCELHGLYKERGWSKTDFINNKKREMY